MLGAGGLPTLPVPPPLSASNPQDAIPPFKPDGYTLTAILTAVQMSFRAGCTTSLESIQLALQLWHVLLPRLRNRPTEHHFTLLVGILGQSETIGGGNKNQKFRLRAFERSQALKRSSAVTTSLEIIPQQLPCLPLNRQTQQQYGKSNPRIQASEQAARNLLQQVSHRALHAEPITQPLNDSSSSLVIPIKEESLVPHSSSLTSVLEIDLQDVNLALKSPVNLLLPLPPSGVRVSGLL